MSCALTDSAGGSGGITSFHGGTQLRPDILGVVQSLPLDGARIGPGVYQVPLRFHFGRPVRVAVSCQVDADARELANVPGAGRKTGESLGDLVLRWGGVSQVRVVGGDALTNLTITAVSGFDYLLEASPTVPVITRIQPVSQGLELEWTDPGPSSYTVETTASLRAGGWTPIPGITWPIHTNYFLLALPAQPAAFFRVRAR